MARSYFSRLSDNGTQVMTFKGYYGATSVSIDTPALPNISANGGFVEFIIAANGATDAQILVLMVHFDTTTADRTISVARATAAIDSTAAQTVKVTGKWDIGGANQVCAHELSYVTLYR